MPKAKFYDNTRLVTEMYIPEIKIEIYLPIIYKSQFMKDAVITPQGKLDQDERIFTPKITTIKYVLQKMNGDIAIYKAE